MCRTARNNLENHNDSKHATCPGILAIFYKNTHFEKVYLANILGISSAATRNGPMISYPMLFFHFVVVVYFMIMQLKLKIKEKTLI